MKGGGNRYATLILYLTSALSGGHTSFPLAEKDGELPSDEEIDPQVRVYRKKIKFLSESEVGE
jgi:hypothetical protein